MSKTKKELEEENKKLREELGKLKEQVENLMKPHITFKDAPAIIEPAKIAGIAQSHSIKGYFARTRVNLRILKNVLNVYEEFNSVVVKTKDKDVSVDIAVTNDRPLLIGKYDTDKDEFIGFAIAPKVGG